MNNSSKYVPALGFNWLTKYYDWLISNFFPEKKIKTTLIDQANIVQGETVMDFGSGTGTLCMMMKQRYPGSNIIGLDIDEKIISIAGKKIQKANLDIRFLQYDGNAIPMADNSVDKIVTSFVLHHLNTVIKEKMFREFHRVLKPGGELHVADFEKPANLYTKLAFQLVRWVDGGECTSINVKGKLRELIERNRFTWFTGGNYFNTIIATIRLFGFRKQS